MDQNIKKFYEKSLSVTDIPNELFKQFDVKKGLRNEDGTGVCVGLTKIADVVGYIRKDGVKKDAHGKLYYRGIEVRDLIYGRDQRNGAYAFEETCFLLLFGFLPTAEQLATFQSVLKHHYELPDKFLETSILQMPSKNLMNQLQQAVLNLYDFDESPDDVSISHTLCQGLSIMAKMPSILCYAYHSKAHHYEKASLHIHYPRKDYSMAENILHMLRADSKFSAREASILDLMLVIHADHGGGNNSTFTNVVISSTGTDIYSAVAGSIGSLKGPRHGGANIQVCHMMEEVISSIGLDACDETIKALQRKILNKDFFDHSGLIYGMGHAIYTLSDPRAELLKSHSKALAIEKNKEAEFDFYCRFEECAKEVMLEEKGIHVSSNVDFYSGFVYDLMNIPRDMFTPLFVCARTVGWLAHNLENKLYDGKIMRPATKYVGELQEYIDIDDRK
ncbi:MAG: citrate synthase [Erysipelotrichaceae bacterium]|nr:citrate synthase [Erysipelotrichaceae bacterium]